MDDAGDLLATLQRLEEELLRMWQSDRVAQLLGDGFVEFGSSGRIYSRTQTIFALAARTSSEITATDFALRRIAPDAALLTYRACHHAATNTFSLRSSIWQLQGGQWRMVFHQGTPCVPPEQS